MRRSAVTIALALVALGATAAAQAPPDLDGLLARVGDRIGDFYRRAQSLICDEKVTAQPIRHDMGSEGFARVLEYDLRIEYAASDGEESDANFVRELRKINGRAPKARDVNDRNSCLDPDPATPEPLTFLLARNKGEYKFSWVGYGKGKDQNAFQIEYRPMKVEKAEFHEDAKGRDDCFQITLPSERSGRVWIDAQTFDVMRIEQRLTSRVDVRIPWAMQRRISLPDSVVVDRLDIVTRYRPVAFKDPEETLLLPASIEELAMFRGAQSHRKIQTFSNYRRFLTGGRIVK